MTERNLGPFFKTLSFPGEETRPKAMIKLVKKVIQLVRKD